MTTPALLSVSGLSKRFGRVVTASDVTFEVPAGRALGIVGPNGAGKSTLLNLINGTLPSDSGTIAFDGADVTRVGAARRSEIGIGRSYQIPRPFGGMTVFENVLVGARFAGGARGSAAHEQAYDALVRTGLAHLAGTRAGSLRLLDRKRLELARALATSPRLILLDEIAGGLTERELPALVDVIAGLRDDGLAVVWIEHIVHALMAVVDELMCIAAGEVVAIGDPADVMADPRVFEVYLGSPAEVVP
ncbi:ABC transporter ATP-binding protein [Nocardioides conyzicola]|uniref:ABC transporter ATP-binding protein n=1 Tax=Nocardioides conyzicola TaxID=1651781 RepID=A0ABP8XAB4_9ACTN